MSERLIVVQDWLTKEGGCEERRKQEVGVRG